MDSIKNSKFGSSNQSLKDKISDKIKNLKIKKGEEPSINLQNSDIKMKSKFDIDMNMGKKSSKNFDIFYKVFLIVTGVVLTFVALIFFVIINPVLGMKDSLTKVQKSANQVSQSLVTDRDLVAYEDNLKKLENDILQIRKERDSRLGHLKNFPYVKDFYNDVDYFVNTGIKLVEAGKEVRPIVEPFADAMGIKVSKDQETK